MKIEDIEKMKARAASMWRPPRANEEKFYADVPFQRTLVGDGAAVLMSGDLKGALDEDKLSEAKKGDIITRGYGSTWVEDRDGEVVHPNAFDKTLEPFLRDNPIMLWQHNMDWPLGKFLDAATDSFGLDMIGLVPKVEEREPDWRHLAYQSIAKGVVRTKSIGGYMRRMYDPEMEKMWIMEVELMETSIVSVPANPASIFEAAVKAAGGASRRPQLLQQHIDQMMQILGAAPLTDPELVLMNEKGLRQRYEELAAYYLKCGKRPPGYDEWNELAKEVHSSKGLAGVRGGATKTVAFIRKVQGHAPPEADVKRGRTISAKNEERLRKVIDLGAEAKGLIDEILKSVESEEVDGDGESES